ncbi:hypothetical protein Ancab_023792 [Ancistrocladus abbreviatus]
MAGNVKFELSSDSPEDLGFLASYPSGQRANYPSLDRSGSFREGSDGRPFSSRTSTKANAAVMVDLPPLSQCLLLEPITLGDQKYTRSGELRRALGFSLGSFSDDNSFGAGHSKPPLMPATDELKRFKTSVEDACIKARSRVKRLDESLNKLSKYSEALNPKRQQANERSGGSSLLKVGTQSHRNSPDLLTQRLDDTSKNVGLSKRARTPIADMRAEARGNGIPRQHLILGKDKDIIKDGSLSCDVVEEKIRRLPAGGEGWDRKMKRKRSVSNVFARLVDGDGELKRAVHGRLSSDSGPQSSDTHGFRSGSSNGPGGINKLDGTSAPASSSCRMTPKNVLEKVSLSREPTGVNKERLLQKGNAKSNMRENSHLLTPGSMTKGKASRALRAGPTVAGASSPNFSRMSGLLEEPEQPVNMGKVHSVAGVHNRKRSMPAESSSPPMAQWVGQRPQKISRTRRTNIVSPTSNQDEMQVSSEGCSADFGAKISGSMNGSLPVRNMTNVAQNLKVKIENVPSPARLSESEETVGSENRLKERAVGGTEVEGRVGNGYQYVGISGLPTKKNKLIAKEESGDGVHRQGRSGRGSSLSRGSTPSLGDKLDNSNAIKPLRSTRPGSDKSGSKSGRPPLKKHSDRKGFTRLGFVSNGSSPDFTGESDDDREELLAAAHFARDSRYHACSSSFWKRMESLFSVKLDDTAYLMPQNNVLQEAKLQNIVSEDKEKSFLNGFMEATRMEDLFNQFQDGDSSEGGKDCEDGPKYKTPLIQRVLSALIIEDECEESEENFWGRNASFLSGRDTTCLMADRITCNGSAVYDRCSSIQISSHDEIWSSDHGVMRSKVGASPGPLQNDLNASLSIPPSEYKYEEMSIDEKLLLELQSVGLYPETVPDLSEGDDELIDQDIAQLKKQLHHQTSKKKAHLERFRKAVEEQKEAERWDLELVALNRLTELAFEKLLCTRGSYASKLGVSKASRHVALAFIKRTLARCRKFEDTSRSCFSEPALRDILLGRPTSSMNVETRNCIGSSDSNHQVEARVSGFQPAGAEQVDLRNDKSGRALSDVHEDGSCQSDHAFAKNGPILNRGKKKEVLLDDVGGTIALRSTSTIGNAFLGGTKGKRTERDRDKDLSRNAVAKAGRPSISNLRGERKTKSKPKQKAVQFSIDPVYPSASDSSELVTNGSSKEREGLASPGKIPDSTKEGKDSVDFTNFPLPELDSIGDLNMENEFGGHQDLSSWLNFDEDNLQDHDSMGLEIPMDDLSELNMIL